MIDENKSEIKEFRPARHGVCKTFLMVDSEAPPFKAGASGAITPGLKSGASYFKAAVSRYAKVTYKTVADTGMGVLDD